MSRVAYNRPWREAPIDPDRLVRAVGAYTVTPDTLTGLFLVTGGAEAYAVDLTDDATTPCDCGDHTWRTVLCKHALAALLFQGNRRVTNALGQVVREAWLANMQANR